MTGVLAADLLQGDGFRDQIPEDVRDAVTALARNPRSWRAYDEVREQIQETLKNGPDSVKGWISKYKGQLGEDVFREQLGDGAWFPQSGSQAGYDVARDLGNGPEYIQVKLYSDPGQVVDKMKDVQERVFNGQILSEDTGLPVTAINWAVPHDIVDEVRSRIADVPELSGITVYSMGITAESAKEIVESGFDAVGAEGWERIADFFGELGGGVASATTVQAAFVGFMWWKGQREAEEAYEEIADTVLTSSAGMIAALAAEEVANSLIFGGPVGFALGLTARQVVRRALSSRREFVRHNRSENEHLARLVARLSR